MPMCFFNETNASYFSLEFSPKIVYLYSVRYDSPAQQSLATVRSKLRPFFLEQLPASVRTSLLEDTATFLLAKSLAAGVDCDYGKSVLHLLYLLLSPDVKRLKVTLCCYYGCRDLDG